MHDPGAAQLRVDRSVEVGAERTVVVPAHGRRHEDPVVPVELFLDVHTQSRVLEEGLAGLRSRCGRDGRQRTNGEVFAMTGRLEFRLGVILHAVGRRGS